MISDDDIMTNHGVEGAFLLAGWSFFVCKLER